VAKEYAKTLDDELDWKLMDQLHGAVSQFSSFCFEIKKFCVTTVFVLLSLIVSLTKSVDLSMFVAGFVVPISFWVLDTTAYYYQVKIRGRMEDIRKSIINRSEVKIDIGDTTKIIEISRTKGGHAKRILEAAFNHSMWIYAILVGADLSVWFLHCLGVIS